MKNPTDFLVQVTKLPAAIEGMLPVGAPKLSAMMVDAAGKLPKLPDFPVTIPDLPDIPAMPAMPGAPTGLRYVTGAEVTRQAVAVRPQSEKIPLVFE